MEEMDEMETTVTPEQAQFVLLGRSIGSWIPTPAEFHELDELHQSGWMRAAAVKVLEEHGADHATSTRPVLLEAFGDETSSIVQRVIDRALVAIPKRLASADGALEIIEFLAKKMTEPDLAPRASELIRKIVQDRLEFLDGEIAKPFKATQHGTNMGFGVDAWNPTDMQDSHDPSKFVAAKEEFLERLEKLIGGLPERSLLQPADLGKKEFPKLKGVIVTKKDSSKPKTGEIGRQKI